MSRYRSSVSGLTPVGRGVVLTVAVLLVAAACGGTSDSMSDEGTPRVMAVAVRQLITGDYTDVGSRPFAAYVIQTSTDPRAGVDTPDPNATGRPLTTQERAEIEAAVEPFGPVTWIDDTDDYWGDKPVPTIGHVAVIRLNEPTFDTEGALVPIGLTCGSLCGIWLTYRLVETPAGWRVTGTEGLVGIS